MSATNRCLPATTRQPTLAAVKQPLPRRVHSQLRTKLLDGSLPPGTRLDYKQLAIDLGVSTTPVREAVAQLASEGFVELIPRLGAVVRSLSHATAVEFYEVREAIETYACGKAAERISPRLLAQLDEKLAAMKAVYAEFAQTQGGRLEAHDLRLFLDADLAFHQTILLGARNPSLAKTVEESQIQARIFFADRGLHDELRVSLACEQHERILDALKAGNPEKASAAMGEHVRQSMAFTLDYLDAPNQA